MTGKLYLCATPIGNLGDMTPRVVETLQMVDVIAAEDTRNSIRLLNHFDIHTPMTSYHEYNKVEKAVTLIGQMNHSRISFFSFLSDGKKPSKQNRLVERPDNVKAVMHAAAPGSEVTTMPASWHIRTSTSPGSEMAGVPASVISATFFPWFICPIKVTAFSTLLYS